MRELVGEEHWALGVPGFRGQERVRRSGPQDGETQEEVTQRQVERAFREGKRLPLHPVVPTC